MFAKLVKYDFRSVLRLWWIAAVASLPLSVIGGFSVQVLDNDVVYEEKFGLIYVMAFLGIFMTVFALIVFAELSNVLVYIRFYRNFFTDEGYLTFTLPVKKSSLLNSKLLVGMLFSVMTFAVIMLDILIILSIGIPKEIYSKEFLLGLKDVFADFFNEEIIFNIVILLEAITAAILFVAISFMVIFVCMTSAAVLVRRCKVLLAVGMIYAASSIGSTCSQLFTFFVTSVNAMIFDMNISQLESNIAASAAMLCTVAILGIVFFVLYTFETYLLDRKLNLE